MSLPLVPLPRASCDSLPSWEAETEPLRSAESRFSYPDTHPPFSEVSSGWERLQGGKLRLELWIINVLPVISKASLLLTFLPSSELGQEERKQEVEIHYWLLSLGRDLASSGPLSQNLVGEGLQKL